MNIAYLSEKQVFNEYFLKNLADNLSKTQSQFIVIHHSKFQNITDIRFQTKRISTYFNEVGYHNLAFSGDQRNIFQTNNQDFSTRKDLLDSFLLVSNCLILNSLCNSNAGVYLEEAVFFVKEIQAQFEVSYTIVFPENPRSLLGSHCESGITAEKSKYLQQIYPEEAHIIQCANSLDAIIIQPELLLPLFKNS